MDRQARLAERRAAVIAAYDAEAPAYDEHDYPSDLQREWVGRALGLIRPGGVVLDAPCRTGKYFPLVAAASHQVVGADQSAGMLAQARARGIASRLKQVTCLTDANPLLTVRLGVPDLIRAGGVVWDQDSGTASVVRGHVSPRHLTISIAEVTESGRKS
jgi:SAM-dependent methyltransferase